MTQVPVEPMIVREEAGSLRFVARDGRLFTLQPGDNRRVTPSLSLVPGLDDSARLVFRPYFDDGSHAVLRAPEPGALWSAAVALAALALGASSARRE